MASDRGICPVCGGEFLVTKAGTMRFHSNQNLRRDWYRAPMCQGYGQPPAGAVEDPIPAAEERGRLRGWAEAVAALRDGTRRVAWLTEHKIWDPGATEYADYLGAAAPTEGNPPDDLGEAPNGT